MIPPTNIQKQAQEQAREQAEKRAETHFRHGSRRATLGRLVKRVNAWMRRCCSVAERKALGLAACLSEELPEQRSRERHPNVSVRGNSGSRGSRSLGPQEVELSRIVGSVGRCEEFDEDFRPLKRRLGSRWKGVYGALGRGKVLPAVKLFKVGDRYFVEDGNHRVSVARHRGAQIIDAEVTEVTEVTEVSEVTEVPGVSLHESFTAVGDPLVGDGEQDQKVRG